MDNGILLYLLILLVGALSSFVQRVSGFGSGIVVMMFMPHFMPVHISTPALSTLFSVGTTSWNAVRYRRHISFRTILPLLAAALIAIPVAVHFAATVPAAVFKAILGAVLILLSVYFLFFEKKVRFRPTTASGLAMGTVSGTLTGLFSTGGPPVVLYLTQALPDKDVYFATIQFFFALTGIYSTAVRIAGGVIRADILPYAAVGFIGCLAGNYLGGLVYDRLNPTVFRRVIYIGMIVSGISMMV